MNTDLIQVLWVEDDPDNIQFYPMEAAQYGLELVSFSCWEEAEESLISDFKRWSAIILDAKCKCKKSDHDNAPRFLVHALSSITKICAENKRVIPWFVLSGGSEDELNDLILDNREEWDGDWKEKKFYSKATDRDMLFHRIPYKAKLSLEMQIRLVYYPDVFKAIKRSGLDRSVATYMEELLLPIHAQNYSGKEYNNMMTKVRKCIEYIFTSMAENGILPNKKKGEGYVLHDILGGDKKGAINTTWCSLILSGKDVKVGNQILVKSTNILPPVLKDSFRRLKEISAANEHIINPHANDEQKKNSRQTEEFLDNIGNAPYLLQSMALELCNIILWYANYLEGHDDEENALNWEVMQ